MAFSNSDNDEVISDINVTPLVDIVLVILIVFLVTAPLVLQTQIPIDLPSAQSGQESKESSLMNIAVTKNGAIFINGVQKELEDIENFAKTNELKPVNAFVSADKNAPYGTFAKVVDTLRIAGITDIALDTQPQDVVELQK